MTIQEHLTKQNNAHPSMQSQDIIKLCYQAAFGAEHLLLDEAGAKDHFLTEYDTVPPVREKIYEAISPDFARVSLSAWKEQGLPPEWLFQMFVHTASKSSVGGEIRFNKYLEAAESLIAKGKLSIPSSEWQSCLKLYLQNGAGPVHHSDTYRQKEKPAYRIVNSDMIRLLPILIQTGKLLTCADPTACPGNTGLSACMGSVPDPSSDDQTADDNSSEDNSVIVIAIDGRAGSGKTTISDHLAFVLEGSIIHMDDFFLPPTLRTEKRLRQPGGNIHHERFQKEVTPFLHKSLPFSYQRFDCQALEYGHKMFVKKSKFRIVEGSYSEHPILGRYGDITVFLDITPEEQINRIRKRNGYQMAEIFSSKWIPMEEAYFEAFNIRSNADLILSTSQSVPGPTVS